MERQNFNTDNLANWKGSFWVSRVGQVYRLWKYKGLKPIKININGRGKYPRISTCVNGKKKNLKVHRIVAETFIPNPENKRQINHINGIKTDNRVENLEWCTQYENMRHAVSLGLHKGAKKVILI